MINKIDAKLHNYSYAHKTNVCQNPVYKNRPNQIKNDLAFTGLPKGVNKTLIKTLETIKSKIRHNVIILSGPSGAGKDKTFNAVKQLDPSTKKAVSNTTRAPRDMEVEGIDYYFITKEKYDEMNAAGKFFNPLELNGNYYGHTLEEVNPKRRGGNVYLNMSAEQIPRMKKIFGKDCFSIFITVTDMKEVKKRLIGRNSETAETLQTRLEYGYEQLKYKENYDKIIVNDVFENTIKEAYDYIQSRKKPVVKLIDKLLDSLKK